MKSSLKPIILSGFNPLQLKPALWIDASRSDLHFQASAGTTAVTDGSVCGFVGDASGNGFNLTSAADNATRPLWQNNSGKPYLSFDGAVTNGDGVRRAVAGGLGLYASTAGYSIFVAASNNPAVSTVLIGDTNTASYNSFTGIAANATTATTADFAIRNDAGGAVALLSTPLVHNNTPKVMGMVDNTKTMTTYHNQTVTGPTAYTRSGVLTIDRFSLGADFSITTLGNFAASVYQVVVVLRPISSGEARKLIRWMGAKMGLGL